MSWKINGTVAYAAQRAWIQNATLRDNVLFGSPMDPERYARVLSACALTSDLDLLEAGDQTEIGEKGYVLLREIGEKAYVFISWLQMSRRFWGNIIIYRGTFCFVVANIP